jgi:hypothetical protein
VDTLSRASLSSGLPLVGHPGWVEVNNRDSRPGGTTEINTPPPPSAGELVCGKFGLTRPVFPHLIQEYELSDCSLQRVAALISRHLSHHASTSQLCSSPCTCAPAVRLSWPASVHRLKYIYMHSIPYLAPNPVAHPHSHHFPRLVAYLVNQTGHYRFWKNQLLLFPPPPFGVALSWLCRLERIGIEWTPFTIAADALPSAPPPPRSGFAIRDAAPLIMEARLGLVGRFLDEILAASSLSLTAWSCVSNLLVSCQ